MTYIFEFTVVGNGKVEIYKNNVLQYSLRAGQGSKIVNYISGDIYMHKCYPDTGSVFLKACDQLGTPCETAPFYSHTVNLSYYFYRYVTFQFGTEIDIPPMISISSIDAIVSDLNQPQTRTFKVSGTGTGNYNILENGTIIKSRTLINGMDLFNINNISLGSHIYCTDPSNSCVSFTISSVKWDCYNDCSAPYVGGRYITQTECQTACIMTCESLAVDTWKPAKTILETNESVKVTVRSKEFNKPFQIGYFTLLPVPHDVILLSGTTDETGCFSGELPAQEDGKYNLSVCFLDLGLCVRGVNPILIRWGEAGTSIETMILYVAVALAAAYIIGNVISGRKK